jgi:tetratricopeptide (TPR) repeat protein
MLAGLEPNAIIFTNGDNDTFPLWYMQEVEHYRPDVRVANLSLLNTNWYIHQLKHNEPKVELAWTDEQVKNLAGSIDRDGNVMQPRDLAVQRILLDNFRKRPIYFAVTIPRDGLRAVEDYLVLEGLVYRVVETKGRDRKDYAKIEHNANDVYVYDGILTAGFKRDNSVYRDENQNNLVQNYAGAFIRVAQYSEANGDSLPDGTARDALYAKAETNYLRAAEISPDFDVLWAQMGTLYIKMGRSQDAFEMYERLAREHPNDDRWQFQMVQGLFAAGKNEEALTRLRTLVGRNPNEEYVHQYFVQILYEMGMAPGAEQVVKEWEARRPGQGGLRDYYNAVRGGLVEPLLGKPGLTGPQKADSGRGR